MHGLYFFVYDVAYLLWTLIYWAASGTQCDGSPYIYSVLPVVILQRTFDD